MEVYTLKEAARHAKMGMDTLKRAKGRNPQPEGLRKYAEAHERKATKTA